MARYRILSKVATGGMAEVYLAKAIGAGGFEKPVALKRMLPTLAADAGFVGQFLREARLSVALQHPNIVQVLDLGVFKNAYYLVMEYVDGENLRSLLTALNERGERLGVAEACWLAIQVGRGLDHAHTRRSPDGRPLNIIHRDINPLNVMVSSSGEVKLADFGIAKAADGSSQTQVGVIKGKASYLSPEQVLGGETDQRSDLFLMGLLLYELLHGRRLFEGANYFHTVKLIESFDPGQLEALPGIGAGLHPILSVCLARDPDARIGRADDLSTALESFLFENRLRVGPQDVAAAFSRAFPERRSPLQAPPPSTLVEIDLEALDPTPAPPAPSGPATPTPAVVRSAPAEANTPAKPPTPVSGNPKPRSWRRFGEILLAHGKVTEAQLQSALVRQKRRGGKLSDFLTVDGLITEEDVIRALGEQSSIPYIGNEKLRTMAIPEVVSLLPEERATQLEAVPISQRGKTVYFAMFDPRDNEVLKTLRLLTQAAEAKGVYATKSGLRQAIRRFYRNEDVDADAEWMGRMTGVADTGLTPFADKVTGTREVNFDPQALDRGEAPTPISAMPVVETPSDALQAEQAALEILLPTGPLDPVLRALQLARRTARHLGAHAEEQSRAGAWLLVLVAAAKSEGRPLWSRPGAAALRAVAGSVGAGPLLEALGGGNASRAAGVAMVTHAFGERSGGFVSTPKPASDAVAALRADTTLPRSIVEALVASLQP